MTWVLWPDKPNIRENLITHIRELDTDHTWRVEIDEYKKPKIGTQRNWFHRLCEIYGQAVGLDKGQVKEIIKAQIFGWRWVDIAGIRFPVADGHSEDLQKMEYSELIEALYRLAAESGVYLPEADPMRAK